MGKILQTFLLGIAAIASTTATAAEEFAYDVVIRNGRLLDGLGNPWVRACIAIKDGRIARIGRCEDAADARSMRATVTSRRAGST